MSENCFADLILVIESQGGINPEIAEESAEFFIQHFDNPRPIFENIENVIIGFGERTIVYIYAALFVIFIIIIFYLLAVRIITVPDAIILSLILFVVFAVILIVYAFTTEDFIESEANVIFNSLTAWSEDQEGRVIPALSETACFYVKEREDMLF